MVRGFELVFESGHSRERERDNRTRTTFGPFERAEQERRREIEPESRVRATFVFLRSVGWIYLLNGIEYTFSLPFIVRRAWPLYPHGVIIQRVLAPTEVEEAELTGDEAQDTQTIQAAMESIIRLYPDQWMWIHRRWKSRPPDEPLLY